MLIYRSVERHTIGHQVSVLPVHTGSRDHFMHVGAEFMLKYVKRG
jgi:hypothetical protein